MPESPGEENRDDVELYAGPSSLEESPSQAEPPRALQFSCPVRMLRRFSLFAALMDNFGLQMTVVVTVVYLLVKGIAFQLVNGSLPLFRDVFSVSGSDYQRLTNVGLMAWALKPLIGILSDTTPFGGFHKRNYMMLAAVLPIAGSIVIALLPGASSLAAVVATCIFGINVSFATLDLLTEGRYSELMVQKPETGASFVSWAWGCAMLGGAIAAAMQGPMADSGLVRVSFGAVAPLMIVVFVPVAANWLQEQRVPSISTLSRLLSSVGRQLVPKRHWIAVYSIFMAAGTVSFATITLVASRRVILLSTIVIPIGLAVFSFRALPRLVAKANLFVFLKEALYIQIPGALDYFFMSPASCVPGGPHFSYTYYQTYTNIVGFGAGMVGVCYFQRYLSHRSFRYAFWATTCLKVVSSLFDFVFVKRWNVVLGISDRIAYFFGNAVVYAACTMMDFMPAVVLTSKLCERGMEATMFALLAGFSNFGQVTSNSVGYLLIDAFGIRTEEPCDFSGLPWLILLGHCFLPLLVIPLTFLVPGTKMTDQLVGDGDGGPLHPTAVCTPREASAIAGSSPNEGADDDTALSS